MPHIFIFLSKSLHIFSVDIKHTHTQTNTHTWHKVAIFLNSKHENPSAPASSPSLPSVVWKPSHLHNVIPKHSKYSPFSCTVPHCISVWVTSIIHQYDQKKTLKGVKYRKCIKHICKKYTEIISIMWCVDWHVHADTQHFLFRQCRQACTSKQC